MYPILLRFTLFEREFIISTYGVSIAVGIVLAFLFLYRHTRIITKSPFEFTTDLMFYILIPAFIGARVAFILAEFPGFLESPMSYIFARGGFVFYGGVIFGFLGGLYYAHKVNIPYRRLADICTPAFGIAHFFGRIGCFLNGCCYGLAVDSNVAAPLEHLSKCGCQFYTIYENEVYALPHLHLPTQLYEAGFALIMTFFSMYLIKRWAKKEGRLFYLYIMSYSIFRFFVEFLRGDDRGIQLFFLSFSQIIALLLLVLLVVCRKKFIANGE